MSKVLILRPEPAASRTADRARALGLDPVVAPLFTLRPLDWTVPRETFDAVLLTSANAARLAGEGLRPLLGLRCFAVGEATAEAARAAGFGDIRSGPSDGTALVGMMASAGVRRALHLCGRDHIALAHPEVRIERRIVYAADAAPALPERAQNAIAGGALVLLHSARAATLLRRLLPEGSTPVALAISRAAANAFGEADVHVAREPRGEALLADAAKLCKTGAAQEAS